MNIAEKLATIAENEQKVYEAGKKAEHDAFWDSYQKNGSRSDYGRAFYGWSLECFKPKYDLKPTGGCNYMFHDLFAPGGTSKSLKAALESCGVELDTSGVCGTASNAKPFTNMFYYSWVSETPTIDTTGADDISQLCYYASRTVTIEKLILKEDGTQTGNAIFDHCTKLANIVIEGTIGCDWDMSDCPLTEASLYSVINALSSTASGKTAKFNHDHMINLFGSESEFRAYIEERCGTKENWTIVLA